MVIQGVPLPAAAAPLHVGEQRTRHLGWVWKQRGENLQEEGGIELGTAGLKSSTGADSMRVLLPCVQTIVIKKISAIPKRGISVIPGDWNAGGGDIPLRVRTPPFQLVSVRCLTRCSQTRHYRRICAHDVTPVGRGRDGAALGCDLHTPR